MRKIYLSLACAALAATPAFAADTLPNASFETWVDCVPWTSNGNTMAIGQTPQSWTISNVIGFNGMGKTEVGSKTEGPDGTIAVTVTNKSIIMNQVVPGYFTLGTTWSTSAAAKENDGGTFGGIEIATRPDAVNFSYKTSEGATGQTFIAYMWKGTFTQADVPGNIVLQGSPVTTTMVNRDRNILGMETIKGGEVTESDGAALVAKVIRPIVASTDWTSISMPFNYENGEAPEMLNIIFAANDYFNAEGITAGNSLSVASPRLVYWSKLSAIEIGGKSLAGFDDAIFNYTVGTLPEASDVKVTVLGAAASANVEAKDGKIVITVTNPDGTDEEGLSEHVYTLSADAPATEPAGPAVAYEGKLTVDMAGETISSEGGDDATIYITPNTDGTSTVLLPNLSLGDFGELGEIKVERVNTLTIAGLTTYQASVTDFELMGGALTAESLTLNGTVTEQGTVHLTIDVVWEGYPIKCSFVGQNAAGLNGITIDNSQAPVEYFDIRGVRVSPSALTPGLYIRRQGSETVKVIIR